MKLLVSQRMYYHDKYKENRDTIDHRLISWINKINCFPILVPNNLIEKKNYKKIKEFINEVKPAGLILTGGDDFGVFKKRDDTEIFLLKYFLKKKKPIFGICRGMLLISKFFGIKPIKKKGHVRTYHKLKILCSQKGFPNKVNSYHNYVVDKCKKNFLINAVAPDQTIESFSMKKNRIECCMWHPERDKVFNKNYISRIKRFFYGK